MKKETEDLTLETDQTDQAAAECVRFSGTRGAFSRTGHMLGRETIFSKVKRIEIFKVCSLTLIE